MKESAALDSNPAASAGSIFGNTDWGRSLANIDKTELCDLITSMFLDCPDEESIAQSLSAHYGVSLTLPMVQRIRLDAALAADKLESSQKRKKWVFRYRQLTLNNLIKEYMFVARIPDFFEAKIELADELYWLGQKYTRNKLWIALNDALGRNNVPFALIDELLEFREATLRVKQLINASAGKKQTEPTALLMEVSEQVADAYGRQFNEDSVKTAEYARDLLGLEAGSVTPADVSFLREYFRCSKFFERTDRESLVRLIQGADSLSKRVVLNEAISGNMANLGGEDFEQLLREMRESPILRAEQLAGIGDFVSRQLNSGAANPSFRRLKQVVEDHLALLDIRKLYSLPELMSLRVFRRSPEELAEALNALNALSKRNEVESYLRQMAVKSSGSRAVESFSERYFLKRFGDKWK